MDASFSPHRLGIAVLVAKVAMAAVLVAQRPVGMAHFPLALADVSLAADTVSGLTVILLPGANTKEEKRLVWLRIHPDSALEWLNSAAYAITAPVPPGAADGVQWSRSLKALNAKGVINIGRARKQGKLQKERWLSVADSVGGWRLEMTEQQADSLLRIVLNLGSLSRIDSTASTALDADQVEVPVRTLRQPKFPPRGVFGRVLVQFVVDADGRADPESLVAYIASDSSLVPDALRTIRESRFQPALRAGQPVRQRVQQLIAWTKERN
jgi:hypothetical protein